MMRTSTSKKALSWLLALAMVFSMLPAAALAAEPETVPPVEQVITIPEEAPAAPAAATTSIGGEISTSQTWDSSTTMSADVTIKGGNSADAPVVITVDGTVNVTQQIIVSEGHVKFSGTGTLKQGNTISGGMLRFTSNSTTTITGVTLDGGAVWGAADNNEEAETFLGRGTDNSGVSGAGFMVAAESTLTLGEGAVVQNFSNNGTIFLIPGTLNVAGATIRDNQHEGNTKNMMFNIIGTLNMTDGRAYGNFNNNTAVPDQTSNCGVFMASGAAAKITISGGTIERNLSNAYTGALSASGGGAITVEGDAKIIDNKAAIGGGAVLIYQSSLTLKGNAELKGNTSTTGGAVFVNGASANFTMEGGAISGNTANRGGGIYVNGGTVKLNAGTIEGNTGANTSDQFGGGGITVMEGTVTIGDGTGDADMLIQENTAYDGAGVMIGSGSTGNGTVTINADAKISGNTGTYGAGVYAAHGAVTIDGATITDNVADVIGGGGGLMVYDKTAQAVTLKGKVTITGNEKGTPGNGANTPDNVLINSNGAKLNLTEALDEAAQVGLHTGGDGHESWPLVTASKPEGNAEDNAKIAADSLACFFDDAGTHGIVQKADDAATLVWGNPLQTELYVDELKGSDTNPGTKNQAFKTLDQALKSAPKSVSSTIYLLSDITFTDFYNGANSAGGAGKTITITSDNDEPYQINVTSDSTRASFHLQRISEKNPTNLTLTNVTVDGTGHGKAGVYGEFFIDAGGSLTLGNKATLQNLYPRAVNVRADGTFTMLPGSKITGCEAGTNNSYGYYDGTEDAGGAVYVCPGGTFEMKGGEISGNTSSVIKGGGVFGEWGAIFKMSGAPVVKENTGGNVYLNTTDEGSQTITVTDRLTDGAEIYVYTSKTPTSGTDVPVATGAESTDLNYFHSDNADYAGLIWCGGDSDSAAHADTPITTTGHTAAAKTIWLSVDARETADIRVSVDTDGKLILEAHELDPSKFYTVLDKDGNAAGLTLETGTSAGNGWFKPTAGGDLVWSGLDPEKGPYQVVSSDSATEPPNGTASATGNGTKVGGQIMALYVAGLEGGSGDGAWAAGVDDDSTDVETSGYARGSRAYPYKTLNYAYQVLDTKYAQAGIITVLSDIEQGATLTVKPTTGAVILGEGEDITVKRADSVTAGHMFTANGDLALYNIILDGNKAANTHTHGALIYIGSKSGDVLLSQNTVLQNNNGGLVRSTDSAGAVAVWSGGTLTMEGNAQIKNCTVTTYGSAVVVGRHGSSGTFVMKDTASITGCEINNNDNLNPLSGYGGAVYVWMGSFSMEGEASVTGNTSKDDDAPGGVFLENGTVTLSGKAKITGNTNTSGAANLCLLKPATVSANGLTDGAVIGVTPSTAPTVGNDVPVTNDTAATKYFFSDHPELYGVKLGADDKVYLAVDAKMTITAGEPSEGKTSIVISPADPYKDYWAVAEDGTKVGPGVYDDATGTVTISGLNPDKAYTVVVVPKGTNSGDVSTPGNGKVEIVSPPATAVKPPKAVDDGLVYQENEAGNSKRDPANPDNGTDTITIKAEDGYSYAVRDKDGNYYQVSGGVNAPATTPVWQAGTSEGDEITFSGLPFDQEYEIVKVKTDKKDNDNAIPAVTDVPTLPPVVSQDSMETALEPDGKASLTIHGVNPDKNYVVVDSEGKVVAAIQPHGNGDIKFPDLDPGAKYQVLTQDGTVDLPAVGTELEDDQLKRATDVTTPLPTDVSFAVSETPGKVDATFKPATADMDYYVKTDSGDAVKGTVNPNGTVTFPGLDPDKEYTMVAVKKDDPAPADFSQVPNHDFKTPSNDANTAAGALKGKDIETTTNTITVKGVTTIPAGTQYVAIGPDGKEHVGKIVGGNLVFDGLNANTKYDIVVRDTVNGVDLDPSINATTKPSNSGDNSPSGGSSASTTVKVDKAEDGKVKVDRPSAGQDQTVTITVTPDPGFELDTLVVKDKNGKELEVKDLGNGKYSFVMPKDKPVTVTATFKKTGATGDPYTNGVAKLLIVDDHIAYMQGDDLGNFRPTGNITRAETAQLFYNLLKDKNVTGSKSFTDVAANAWYATAVNALANLGIVEGVGDGLYEPDRAISRAEFVTIAMRFATNVTGEKTFTDVAEDYWARGYITGAAYYGWINGYEDGTFKPMSPIARAEAATVVNNMLAREGDKDFIDKAEGLKRFPDVAESYWAFYEIVEATNAHDFARDDQGVESWSK